MSRRKYQPATRQNGLLKPTVAVDDIRARQFPPIPSATGAVDPAMWTARRGKNVGNGLTLRLLQTDPFQSEPFGEPAYTLHVSGERAFEFMEHISKAAETFFGLTPDMTDGMIEASTETSQGAP